MTPLKQGWKIVCPDGRERHCPYFNHGDALFDAGVFSNPGHPNRCECGGDKHEVEPHAFQPSASSTRPGARS